MNKREMVLKAAEVIEVKAILLPDNFDNALIGYTIPEDSRTAVVGVYDYDKAACRPSIDRKCAVDLDLEDALLDAIRAIEGDVKPVIIHTGELLMNCWWCRRERKCNEYRMRWMRGFVPLCECCTNGFREKITKVKQ